LSAIPTIGKGNDADKNNPARGMWSVFTPEMKDEYEQRYHRLEENHWWMRARRQICRGLVCRMNPKRDLRILEIGCSGGLLLRELRQQGYEHVTGIDISPAAVERCRARGIKDVHVMDAQRLTFENGQFDALIASDVLEHLSDDVQALREWRRILTPNGSLLVFVPAFPLLWSEHDEANQHYRRYRRADLRQRLHDSGFVVERSSYWIFSLFLSVLLVRLLKRLWRRKKGAVERPDLFKTPALIDWMLSLLLGWENWCLERGLNWPFGVSVMAVARNKPL
jgi:SAM-dependent methyltransferase